MSSTTDVAPSSKATLWVGRVLTALPVVMLTFSALMKFSKSQQLLEEFARLGYPPSLAPTLGIVELACTIIYAVPRTSVLGAILLTGYLGGAVATHVRIEDPPMSIASPVIGGVIVWLGIYFRDARLRALAPLRQ